MPASSPTPDFWRAQPRDPGPDSGKPFEAPNIPWSEKSEILVPQESPFEGLNVLYK